MRSKTGVAKEDLFIHPLPLYSTPEFVSNNVMASNLKGILVSATTRYFITRSQWGVGCILCYQHVTVYN